MPDPLHAARENLAHIDAQLDLLENDTRQRIVARVVHVGGNRDTIERIEWGKHYDRVVVMLAEREALVVRIAGAQ